jgi:hypothetical protein
MKDDAMFNFVFDEQSGILHISSDADFFDSEQATAAQQELTAQMAEARRRAGVLRIVSDARSAAVAAREVTESFRRFASAAIRSPRDRVAIVVSSMLLKLQIEHADGSAQVKVFHNPAEALTWVAAS